MHKDKSIQPIYAIAHYVLIGLAVLLPIFARFSNELILKVYDLLSPVTPWITEHLLFVELFSRFTVRPSETAAYVCLAYLSILAIHSNMFFALRRCAPLFSLIEQDTRLDWHSYLCRYLYSYLRPSLTIHCIGNPFAKFDQQVPLKKGMSPHEVIHSFFTARIHPSVKGHYLVMVLLLFIALPYLGWSMPPVKSFRFLYTPEVLLVVIYLQVSILFEFAMLTAAYLSTNNKEEL